MKYLKLILFFLITFFFCPSSSIVGEVVYSVKYSPELEQVNIQQVILSPVERTKAKEKKKKRKFKRSFRRLPFKEQKIHGNKNPWIITGSIIGYIFLLSGLIFLPIILLLLILGIPFILGGFLFPILFIILGIFLLSSAINSAHQVQNKVIDKKQKRRRTFAIASLIIGGGGILSGIALIVSQTILVVSGILPLVVNLIAFILPILGIILGIFMILSSIPIIDRSYGTYSNNPILFKKRLKRQIIYSFIGFALFALAALFFFLFSAWIVALGLLATSLGMLINALMKIESSKNLGR